MILRQSLATIAPSLGLLAIMYATKSVLAALFLYAHGYFVLLYLGTFLPLLIGAFRLFRGHGIQPWMLLLPLGPPLLFPLYQTGESIAAWFPACCEISTAKIVHTSLKEKSGERIYFQVRAGGTGNPYRFEFTNASISCSKKNERFENISWIYLPAMRGHYRNSYTVNFDITRETLLEFVEKTDDFQRDEAEQIAIRLHEVLLEFIEKKDLPPLEAYAVGIPPPAFYYRVKDDGSILMTMILSVPILFGISLLLAACYIWLSPDRDAHSKSANQSATAQKSKSDV